jgi:hypothetical protein
MRLCRKRAILARIAADNPANVKGGSSMPPPPVMRGFKERQTFENSWSTYSQLIR